MLKNDFNFWIDYHNRKIKRQLTEKEISEIRANDFAMSLLVPTDTLLKLCDGYERMEIIYSERELYGKKYIDELSYIFQVPSEVILCKMKMVINNHYSNLVRKNNRVLNKKKNVIYVNFK